MYSCKISPLAFKLDFKLMVKFSVEKTQYKTTFSIKSRYLIITCFLQSQKVILKKIAICVTSLILAGQPKLIFAATLHKS